MNNYFTLISQYYPKNLNGNYTRDMNMGEFAYFWGCAAGTDSKSLATNAFGWTIDYGNQYQQAKKEFNIPINRTINKPYFMLVNKSSGKAADLIGGDTSDGEQAHDWPYNDAGLDQQWDLVNVGNRWYELKNVKSGKALEVANSTTADDGKLQQKTYVGTDNQKWRLQFWGDYYIKADSGKYVCVQGKGNTNGSKIIQYQFEANPWFKWRFEDARDGFSKISSLNALGKVLCVEGASTESAHITHLWDYNPNNIGDQKVRVEPLTNGKFKFYFAHDGQVFDIPGGQTANDVPLEQYPSNGNSWQKFSIERVQ